MELLLDIWGNIVYYWYESFDIKISILGQIVFYVKHYHWQIIILNDTTKN